jgi:hypothetical protein
VKRVLKREEFKVSGAAAPPCWAGSHHAGVLEFVGEDDVFLQSFSLFSAC